jgi:rRNA maturation endonuclease Nob1
MTDQQHEGSDLDFLGNDLPDDNGTQESGNDSESSDQDKASKKREEMAQAWTKKVLQDPSKLDELREKQGWLADIVASRVEESKVKENATQTEKLAELAREEAKKLLKEQAEEQALSELQSSILALGLSNAEQAKLKEEAQDLKNDGLSTLKALQIACKTLGYDMSSQAMLRKSMAMPTMPAKVKSDDLSDVRNQANWTDQQTQDYLKKKKGLN